MEDMYTLAIDPGRNLIDLSLTGFWRAEETEAFCEELRCHIAKLGAGAGQHVMLCDLTGATVAPADTIAVLGQILANPAFVGLKARRLAFYTPSALLRLQMGRITGVRDGIGVFDTRAAAEAWLAGSSITEAA